MPRPDIVLRRNFSTLAAPAWALYRAREFAETMDTIDCALASGATDAHSFVRAAMIYQSAGAHGKSARYLEAAVRINPDYAAFHVHR
jgi:Tfp pilus assembly protein PilF